MELDPDNKLVDPTGDALYNYDALQRDSSDDKKLWAKDPNYFKTVRISSAALIKMVMHARSGGSLEVMGLMQGYVDGTALVVTDAFRLPVEGTETRVNAQDEANEYLVEYLRLCREAGALGGGRDENVVGWYHSHPGYGCWLSGIDVNTQHMQQMYNDPFVAVVVDPDRTVSSGKVDIGAFRTYPENYKAEGGGDAGSGSGGIGPDGYQTVPLSKAEDFGAHSSRYYPLEIEHFKSTLDARLLELLWNKYWVGTLSQSPLFTNRDYSNKQMLDLAGKVSEAAATVQRSGRGGSAAALGQGFPGLGSKGPVEHALDKALRDGRKVCANEAASLMATEVKVKLFGEAESGTS